MNVFVCARATLPRVSTVADAIVTHASTAADRDLGGRLAGQRLLRAERWIESMDLSGMPLTVRTATRVRRAFEKKRALGKGRRPNGDGSKNLRLVVPNPRSGRSVLRHPHLNRRSCLGLSSCWRSASVAGAARPRGDQDAGRDCGAVGAAPVPSVEHPLVRRPAHRELGARRDCAEREFGSRQGTC